jgi:hypothetical protein
VQRSPLSSTSVETSEPEGCLRPSRRLPGQWWLSRLDSLAELDTCSHLREQEEGRAQKRVKSTLWWSMGWTLCAIFRRRRRKRQTSCKLAFNTSINTATSSTAVESRYNVESQSSEPKLTYLAYDGFSADCLSRRYQNRSGRTHPESLELENYVKCKVLWSPGCRNSCLP